MLCGAPEVVEAGARPGGPGRPGKLGDHCEDVLDGCRGELSGADEPQPTVTSTSATLSQQMPADLDTLPSVRISQTRDSKAAAHT